MTTIRAWQCPNCGDVRLSEPSDFYCGGCAWPGDAADPMLLAEVEEAVACTLSDGSPGFKIPAPDDSA